MGWGMEDKGLRNASCDAATWILWFGSFFCLREHRTQTRGHMRPWSGPSLDRGLARLQGVELLRDHSEPIVGGAPVKCQRHSSYMGTGNGTSMMAMPRSPRGLALISTQRAARAFGRALPMNTSQEAAKPSQEVLRIASSESTGPHPTTPSRSSPRTV